MNNSGKTGSGCGDEEQFSEMYLNLEGKLKGNIDKKIVQDIYKEISGLLNENLVSPDIDEQEPVRCIYHVACSGGTLITKFLAAMPNVLILNELDPLSTLAFKLDKPEFRPADLITLVREGEHDVDNEIIIKLFQSAVESLRNELQLIGKKIILRGHIHSQYFTLDDPGCRKSINSILNEKFQTLSVVTVRDPVDSFLSLTHKEWIHFDPKTFEEYCRRYLLFLYEYKNIKIFKYEDCVKEPKTVLQDICNELKIDFVDNFADTFGFFRFSGDSGRTGMVIEIRERQEIPEDIRLMINESESYEKLIDKLGYQKC